MLYSTGCLAVGVRAASRNRALSVLTYNNKILLRSCPLNQTIRTQFSRAAKKVAGDYPIQAKPGSDQQQLDPSNASKLVTEKTQLASQSPSENSQSPKLSPKTQPEHLDQVQPGLKSEQARQQLQADRAQRLFPKFMRRYAVRIIQSPVSHITSFLIVHELTAVIPLFALWGCFYQLDYVPTAIPEWVFEKGTGFIRRMAERNDWTILANAEAGSRLLLQGAAAYAVVKAIMPFRLVFSVWATPYFARWFIIPINKRVSSVFWKLFKRRNKS